MNNEKWAIVRKRAYLSLPYLQALLVAYGLTSDAKAALWVGLAGVIIGPVMGHTAAKNVDIRRAQERDTLSGPIEVSDVNPYEPGSVTYAMREYGFISGPEHEPVQPCHYKHGAAEPHVKGCQGWTSEPT